MRMHTNSSVSSALMKDFPKLLLLLHACLRLWMCHSVIIVYLYIS